MEIVRSIEIGRERAAVHRYVTDPLNDPEWCPKVLSVHALSGPKGRYEVVHRPIPFKPPRRMRYECLESTPTRVRWRGNDGMDVFDVTYELEEVGPASTGFTQRSLARLGTPRPLHPLMRAGIGHDISRQLKRLKGRLEARITDPRAADAS